MKHDASHPPCNLRKFPLPVSGSSRRRLPSWSWALRWIALGVVTFAAMGLATVLILKAAS